MTQKMNVDRLQQMRDSVEFDELSIPFDELVVCGEAIPIFVSPCGR